MMKKVTVALIIVTSFKGLHAAEKPTPNIVFERNVRSFNTLTEANKFEDLKNWGLVAPDQYNHAAGKNLILLALNPTAARKGDWMSSIGLLGVQMLNCDVTSRQAYKSLLAQNLVHNSGVKMYGTTLVSNNGPVCLSISSKSVIGRREAAIYGIGSCFFGRYCACPASEVDSANQYLKRALDGGIKVYLELLAEGYDDKTLKDAVNMARASLDLDKLLDGDSESKEMGPLQIYRDALIAAIGDIKGGKFVCSADIFSMVLQNEMFKRGLTTDDEILLPRDAKPFAIILKIIELDLTNSETKSGGD